MIELHDLTKRYGNTVAVENLSFQVDPGHVTGFLGPNGAGKSTTMRVLLGLDRPTRGTALVAGRPYRQQHNPLRQMGALLEVKSVHQGRTAFNHLLCLAQANGIGKRRVHEVLDMVGLTSVAVKRTRGFSLGMSQRLGIAQALLGDPPILMLDEPGNGLDPEGIRWLRELLKALAAEGRTVFVSSHLMSEMALMAHQLVIIGRGRLIADTTVEEFTRRSVRNHVRVRTPEPAELADQLARQGITVTAGEQGYLEVSGVDCSTVGDIAADNRIRVHELFGHRVSLEDAFMELTGGSADYTGQPPGSSAPERTPQPGTTVDDGAVTSTGRHAGQESTR